MTQVIYVPAVKKVNEMISICCLPKRADNDAMTGWKMAEVRRYDVPAQKASTEVPCNSCAIT